MLQVSCRDYSSAERPLLVWHGWVEMSDRACSDARAELCAGRIADLGQIWAVDSLFVPVKDFSTLLCFANLQQLPRQPAQARLP